MSSYVLEFVACVVTQSEKGVNELCACELGRALYYEDGRPELDLDRRHAGPRAGSAAPIPRVPPSLTPKTPRAGRPARAPASRRLAAVIRSESRGNRRVRSRFAPDRGEHQAHEAVHLGGVRSGSLRRGVGLVKGDGYGADLAQRTTGRDDARPKASLLADADASTDQAGLLRLFRR